MKRPERFNNRSLALCAIFAAQAMALSFLERFIPFLPGLPPGFKPGFSNIIIMFCAGTLQPFQTVIIALLKSAFVGVTQGVTAFFMSLAGGILSCAAAIFLFRRKSIFGCVGTGIICAVLHNLAQLCTACIIMHNGRLFISYGIFLLAASLVTGSLTGLILKALIPALNKQFKIIKAGRKDEQN